MSAIFASFSTAFTSSSVVVGDFKSKVSEMIADNINVAISFVISMPFSSYNLHKIVSVQPTGSNLKNKGYEVSNASLWWSTTFKIFAFSKLSTDSAGEL